MNCYKCREDRYDLIYIGSKVICKSCAGKIFTCPQCSSECIDVIHTGWLCHSCRYEWN